MITALEVTDWKWPNHTYLLDDSMSKMFGYIKASNGEKVMFEKPMRFDIRGRKFNKVRIEEEVKGTIVVGSKGEKYLVTETTCSCTGFKFRGTCRHFKEVNGDN